MGAMTKRAIHASCRYWDRVAARWCHDQVHHDYNNIVQQIPDEIFFVAPILPVPNAKDSILSYYIIFFYFIFFFDDDVLSFLR